MGEATCRACLEEVFLPIDTLVVFSLFFVFFYAARAHTHTNAHFIGQFVLFFFFFASATLFCVHCLLVNCVAHE